jgi:hypothetical protein
LCSTQQAIRFASWPRERLTPIGTVRISRSARSRIHAATNLLGLIKHITYGEIEYLGDAFGRPSTPPPWWKPQNVQHTLETGGDMYAVPGETTQYIVDLYRKACANADQTIAELDLDTSEPCLAAERNSPCGRP